MALRPLNSIQGFSVGNDPQIDVIYANGDVAASNLVVANLSNLGNIANITISGGSNGQAIITDGNGVLSFGTVDTGGNIAAPMPYQIDVGNSYIVPDKFQGLYSYPITIDGELVVDGYLIELGTPIDSEQTGEIFFSVDDVPTGNTGFTFDQVSGNMAVPGNINVSGNVIPAANTTYNLGSATNKWNDLYLAGNTIYIGNAQLSTTSGGNLTLQNPDGGRFVVIGNTEADSSKIANGNSRVATHTSNIELVANNTTVAVLTNNLANFSGVNVAASGLKTDNIYYANGSPYTFANAGGSNNQVQFNSNGAFGGSANLTFNSSTNLLTVGGPITLTGNLTLAANTAIHVGNSTGSKGQVLVSNGNSTSWATQFYYGNTPPDFNVINYGDIFFYIDTPNNFQRLYMWVTDGTSDYFYDFLPPSF